MTERIPPARLAEIEQVTERVRGHTYREPVYLALTELLAELREVTRERDEARAKYDHVKEERNNAAARAYAAEQERDKLKAECAAMREALTLLHKYDTGTGCHTYEDITFVRADALSTNAGADLLFERDKLKQELADLNYKAGNEYAIVMHYKGEMDALREERAKGFVRPVRSSEGEFPRSIRWARRKLWAIREWLERTK